MSRVDKVLIQQFSQTAAIVVSIINFKQRTLYARYQKSVGYKETSWVGW